jgi:cytochrome c
MQSPKLFIALGGALLTWLAAFNAQADALMERPKVAYGQPISEADLELWNIDIHTPTGKGLPPGQGTVKEGREIYEAKCAACHGENAQGGAMYGTMVGGIGTMNKRPRVLTPSSMYPYASIFFDYVRRAMPLDAPQSLTPDEVYSLAAYIYNLDGLVEENFVMNASTMPKIQMPNRGNFFPDTRPDTKAERCMKDCKPIGTIADGEARLKAN